MIKSPLWHSLCDDLRLVMYGFQMLDYFKSITTLAELLSNSIKRYEWTEKCSDKCYNLHKANVQDFGMSNFRPPFDSICYAFGIRLFGFEALAIFYRILEGLSTILSDFQRFSYIKWNAFAKTPNTKLCSPRAVDHVLHFLLQWSYNYSYCAVYYSHFMGKMLLKSVSSLKIVELYWNFSYGYPNVLTLTGNQDVDNGSK